MRKRFNRQGQFGLVPISELQLNLECRDEIIPLLTGLQYIFSQSALRSKMIDLVKADVNESTNPDLGREGLEYWQIFVLATIRLGCNLDYDKLQDLCENHRSLRCLLQVGEMDSTNFGWRRIRDTLCLLSPETIAQINHLVVSHGQELLEDAASSIRVDSFVVETNIHYPTESSLIWDGIRKLVPLCARLADRLNVKGWRQFKKMLRAIKDLVREISRISASKSAKTKERLPKVYKKLLGKANGILQRAKSLISQEKPKGKRKVIVVPPAASQRISHWIELTEIVCDTANRRVLLGETVPNDEKLFSLFETHTQLYRRGKAGTPNQFGRLALIMEDKAGFISHYSLFSRDEQDSDVVVKETKQAQKKHRGQISSASFDRGFFSESNKVALAKIVDEPCLPPKDPKKYAEAMEEGSVKFHQSRQRHSGVESIIGALQQGNGLKRCRDRSEIGLERYLGLAILGRNIHTLGKHLIQMESEDSEAAKTKRKAA